MIEATNLANYYGRHAAIADSSFSVKPVVGEVLDLVAERIADGDQLVALDARRVESLVWCR
jgi:ABC-type phosphonate transport system ATPase subunit